MDDELLRQQIIEILQNAGSYSTKEDLNMAVMNMLKILPPPVVKLKAEESIPTSTTLFKGEIPYPSPEKYDFTFIDLFAGIGGFRFRLHVKDLPGKPDIVLPKYKTVIEVRGCYWHRHEGCKDATTPSTNTEFWKNKFAATVARDKRTEQELKALGWKVIVPWECEISSCCTRKLRLYHMINQQKETFYLDKTPKHYQCDF